MTEENDSDYSYGRAALGLATAPVGDMVGSLLGEGIISDVRKHYDANPIKSRTGPSGEVKMTPEMADIMRGYKKKYGPAGEAKAYPLQDSLKKVIGAAMPDYGQDSPHASPNMKLLSGSMKSGVHLGTSSPDILAHEMGHNVDMKKFPRLFKYVRPLLGMGTAGAAAGMLGSDKYKDYAPGVAAAGYGAATILPEMTASYRALKILKEKQNPKDYKASRGRLGRLFATYLAGGAARTGAVYGMSKLPSNLNSIRDSYKGGEKTAMAKIAANDVAAIAVIHDGKILMGKRRDTQKWTQPGGHVERGETPLVGAKRELYEETGIRAKNLQPMEPQTLKKGLRIHPYIMKLRSKPRTTVRHDPDDEVYGWQWVDPARATAVMEKLHVPLKDNVIFKNLMKRGLR